MHLEIAMGHPLLDPILEPILTNPGTDAELLALPEDTTDPAWEHHIDMVRERNRLRATMACMRYWHTKNFPYSKPGTA